MERKIGEIFEYNGEWYQCVEHKGCHSCAFDLSYSVRCSFNGVPHCFYRSDGKPVIFKKLERVGEIYEKRISDDTFSTFQRYKVYGPAILPKEPYIYYNFIDNTIEIEIKQNKEDMEEKKLNLKPFDLEAAKAGKPVCTRDGRKARIICFDRDWDMHIVALVSDTLGESVHYYLSNGKVDFDKQNDEDLMMLPEKKEGWINIYNADTTFYYADGRVFETKDEAVQEAKEEVEKEQREKNEYIDTIRVEWEE